MLGTASQIYTYTIGETAKLLWRRSEREHFKEFRQYRAWKEEISFATIINGSQTARCLDDILKTFCLTKVKFQVWNETHLLLSIKNSSYDDSGDYSVEHVFEGLEGNHKSKVSLKIQAKPTDIIPSHHNLTKDDNKTIAKPTDIIPSHPNSTKDDNRTLDTKRKTDGSLALYFVLAAVFLSVLIWLSFLMLSISRRSRQAFASGLS